MASAAPINVTMDYEKNPQPNTAPPLGKLEVRTGDITKVFHLCTANQEHLVPLLLERIRQLDTSTIERLEEIPWSRTNLTWVSKFLERISTAAKQSSNSEIRRLEHQWSTSINVNMDYEENPHTVPRLGKLEIRIGDITKVFRLCTANQEHLVPQLLERIQQLDASTIERLEEIPWSRTNLTWVSEFLERISTAAKQSSNSEIRNLGHQWSTPNSNRCC